MTFGGLLPARLLHLQVNEEAETRWFGGGKSEDLSGSGQYTCPHRRPELVGTDHCLLVHTKARAGGRETALLGSTTVPASECQGRELTMT